MSKKERFTIAQFMQAIAGTGGLRTQIAKKLDCSYDTVLNYIKRHQEIQKAIQTEEEKVLDMAESALFGLIQDGDTGAIFYYLNNKGKKRGYGYNPKLAALAEADKGEEKVAGVLVSPGMLTEDIWEKEAARPKKTPPDQAGQPGPDQTKGRP